MLSLFPGGPGGPMRIRDKGLGPGCDTLGNRNGLLNQSRGLQTAAVKEDIKIQQITLQIHVYKK